MNWMEERDSHRFIKDLKFRMQENECILTWHWPEGIPCVYIHKSRAEEAFELDAADPRQWKLYTREEYKVHTGYREAVEGIGRYTYRVFPCILQEGKPVMLVQDNTQNMIHVSTGKARITYGIKTRKSFFSKYQSVQIHITTEIPIPKEALCYVKKEGSFPVNKDDGTQYAFIRDFQPGRNIMPEIELKKNDFIRIFFTDGKKYGEIYELFPE